MRKIHIVKLMFLLSMSSLHLTALCQPETNNPMQACTRSEDSTYGGILVDCRQINLTCINASSIPENATTLLLDSNMINEIQNHSFSSLKNLKYLSIRGNVLTTIDLLAFEGLAALEILDLEDNNLTTAGSPWTEGVFQTLSNLKQLKLASNRNSESEGAYPSHLFKGLDRLVALTLDTFLGELDFQDAFDNLTALSSLRIQGEMRAITNDSFRSFGSTQLSELSFSDVYSLVKTEAGAFRKLHQLQSYYLSGTYQGIEETFSGLFEFQNRTFKYLVFENIGKDTFSSGSTQLRDGILDLYKARYLSQICVEHFSLTQSQVYVVERQVVTGPVWRKCLKTIDLSGNPLTGDRVVLLEMAMMKVLQSINFSGRKSNSIFNEKGRPKDRSATEASPLSCIIKKREGDTKHRVGREYSMFTTPRNTSEINGYMSSKDDSQRQTKDTSMIQIMTGSHQEKNDTIQGLSTRFRHQSLKDGELVVTLPRSLEILHFESFSSHQGEMSRDMLIMGADNVREVYDSDNGVRNFIGTVKGLHNLQIYDISYNDASVISPTFFDFFPSLVSLNMQSTMLDSKFMSNSSRRLYQNLTRLRHLDLSGNALSLLEEGTFKTNPDLQSLKLATNRFYTIPFDIKHTPNLCYLDLRSNSILDIQPETMTALDAHVVEAPGFSLLLEGNILACDCSHIKFLNWLQETLVNLDNARNYTCITETGYLTTTYARRDVKGMWRKCVGKTFFLFSLILASLMMLSFVTFTLCIRLKTRIVSAVLQIISPEFTLKKPSDYSVDVCINYADGDTALACHTLRTFIEGELNMSSYLRDRDLLPASDMAESIVDIVNKSWRVLIVVTEDYLDNEIWAYFTMKTAAYAVTHKNPGLIVVLVDEQVKHRMPRCLLRAVDEEHIICLPNKQQLFYEQKQKLRNAFFHYAT